MEKLKNTDNVKMQVIDHSFPDEYFPFNMLVLSVKASLMITVTFTEKSMYLFIMKLIP